MPGHAVGGPGQRGWWPHTAAQVADRWQSFNSHRLFSGDDCQSSLWSLSLGPSGVLWSESQVQGRPQVTAQRARHKHQLRRQSPQASQLLSMPPEGVTRARAPDAHERGGTDFWQAMASLSWTKVTFYASFQQNAPVLPPWAPGKQGRHLIGPVTLLNAQGKPDLHRYRNQAHSPDFALDSSVITSQS